MTGNAAVSGTRVEYTVEGDAEPAIDIENGVLTVTDNCDGDGCSVSYFILVESDTDVAVTSGSGNVLISDNSGTIDVDAGDGNVTLATVTGEFSVVVGSGDILGTRLDSAMATFEATDGDVDVTFDVEIATLVVATGKGNVTVQLPDGAYEFDTPDDAELRIDGTPGADNKVSLETGDGSVIVYKR